MRLTRPAQVFLAAAALAAAGATGVAGGAADASSGHARHAQAHAPTYQQFKHAAFRDTDGQWIVNGDEPVSSKRELRAYYRSMLRPSKKVGHASASPLIVDTVGGADDVWDPSTLGDLTYCVSDDFGAAKATVVSAMAQGSSLWENSSSAIDFVYDGSQDADCTVANSAVVFSVEPTTATDYIARSFFPSSPESERNVLVNPDSLVDSGSWTPGNILGHEQGHILGFRHEHTRPEAGTCFEDDNWRALTPYDSVSIMHYPQCNGGSDDLTFSSLDAQGVQSLYGS